MTMPDLNTGKNCTSSLEPTTNKPVVTAPHMRHLFLKWKQEKVRFFMFFSPKLKDKKVQKWIHLFAHSCTDLYFYRPSQHGNAGHAWGREGSGVWKTPEGGDGEGGEDFWQKKPQIHLSIRSFMHGVVSLLIFPHGDVWHAWGREGSEVWDVATEGEGGNSERLCSHGRR